LSIRKCAYDETHSHVESLQSVKPSLMNPFTVPVVLALASSLSDRTVPNSLISFGELGLTGEVRPVAYGEERLREAQKQGFKVAVVPRENTPRKPLDGLHVIPVSRVGEALEAAFSRSP